MRSSSDAPVPRLRRADDAWRQPFVERAATADRLVLMTDFDGTVAEIRDRPDAAAILPAARASLERLAADDGSTVAVVSGRSLSDVRERVGVSGVWYAGNHGLEISDGGRTWVHPEAADREADVGRVCDALRDRLDDVDGAVVEDKGVTASIHYRRVRDEGTVRRVEKLVREAAESHADSLQLTGGKRVLELRPDIDWHKGTAVSWILEKAGIGGAEHHALYLGDDATDESAFREVTGSGTALHVGEPSTGTAADCWVRSPAEAADLLRWLAESRCAG